MRRLALLTFAALALSACDRLSPPPEPGGEGSGPSAAATSFDYAATGDLSGFYMPVSEVRIGQWVLRDVFVGQAAEFAAWKAGQRSGTFAPVMLEFEAPDSPTVQTELGESHTGQVRVLPDRFSVSDDRIRFEGRSKELGRVTFDGRLDQGALATARRNLGDDGAVVTGTLSAGGQRAGGVRLRWWMGD
jgi:hypothetical protein